MSRGGWSCLTGGGNMGPTGLFIECHAECWRTSTTRRLLLPSGWTHGAPDSFACGGVLLSGRDGLPSLPQFVDSAWK